MSTVSAPPRPRKPRKAAAPPPDVCRLIVEIRGVAYAVRRLAVAPAAGVRSLWRFRKLTDGATYHVARHADGSTTCECGDAEFRHNGQGGLCKHGRALAAVVAILKGGSR